MALASRKYYESRKNDPEFIEKRHARYRIKKDKELELREQEKLLNPPPEPPPKEPKEKNPMGRPRKYL